jgi:hypothetical protein
VALVTANSVHGLIEPAYNVEAIQNVDGLRRPTGDDIEASSPHVVRNELPGRRANSAELTE